MSTFVLVTGAWHGGWAWKPVADRLRAAGHTVYAPTLPGLTHGEDPRSLTLADCAHAVVDLAQSRDLTDITLVGHSWGGYPITAVANAIPKRLRRLIYWSAFVPAEGASLYDEVPPQYQELFSQLAQASDTNTVALPLEVWQQAFMNDASAEAQRIVHSLLVPTRISTSPRPCNPLPPAMSTSRTCWGNRILHSHRVTTTGIGSPGASASSRSRCRAVTKRASLDPIPSPTPS